MLQFVLLNILMISVAAILYITARALPRIEDEPHGPRKQSVLERWIASEMPEKIDQTFNGFLWKVLRKLKVVLLKVDNIISKRLQRIKETESGGPSATHFEDFKRIAEDKKNERNKL